LPLKTQVRATQILDHNLTGASFSDLFNIYDETKSYSSGDIVWYAGKIWKALNNIPSATEGDLSQAPKNNSDWKEITFKDLFQTIEFSISNIGDSFTINI